MARVPSVRGFAQLVTIALPLAVGVLVAWKGVDVPSWDEWEWADLVYKMHLGTLQFADVWAQHSEHRMLFPNLIMLGLARLGGWYPVREQFVSLGVLVLSQLAIIPLVRRSAHGTVGAIAVATASLLMYGLWQSENFDWGFQTAWFLCNACAIVVALLLTRPHSRPIDVFLAMAIAVIGSFSSSQGLLIWAVGVVAIVLTSRRPALTLFVWVPAAIATYLVYRHGMLKVEKGHFDVLADPPAAMIYALVYLGSPVARWLGSTGSALAGAFVVIQLAAAFAADVRSPHRVRLLIRAAPWYALASYPLLCAVATAAGRAGLGIDQALSGRYTSVGTIAWVAVTALAASRVSRWPRPLSERRVAAILAIGTTFVFAIVAGNFDGWDQWQANAAQLALARSELGRSDPAALPTLYPNRDRIILLIGEMRTVHDGIFAGR